jgi:hypothetical protein
MRFLSPLALFGLALVTLPVVIHLLVRRRAGRLDFPTLKFLRETPSFRLRPRRIQQPLLLALRAAALILLVIGFARPFISFNSQTKPLRIILLDASLSMSAQGRAQAALEQAQSIINNLAAGERAAIITFSSEATVLSEMTSDKRTLSEALGLYQATAGAASYAKAFRAANALLEREPPGAASLELISDFQQSGLTQDNLPQLTANSIASAQVVAHPIGASFSRNAFLLNETSGAGERGNEISAHEIIAAEDGRSGARKSWPLDSGAGARADIEWRTEDNGQISARIRTLSSDEFDADDERFLVLGPPRQPRALLLEQDEDDAMAYLRAALEATASELGQKSFMLERKNELPLSAGELNSYSLIVLMLRKQPRAEEMRALASFASEGGTVWLCVGRDVDTVAWNEFARSVDGRAWPFVSLSRKNADAQPLSFGPMDRDAPVLSFVEQQVLESLQALRMREGYALEPRVDAATIMRWNDGTPALAQSHVGSGRLVLLATSPARSAGELGISPSFPALASSIARSSLAPREPLAKVIGEPLNLKLSPATSVRIVDAQGKSQAAQARDLMLHPAKYFSAPGIYRVEAEGLTRYLAFNAPAAESEGALASAFEIKKLFGPQTSASERQPRAWHESFEQQGSLWRYFLLAAFLLLIAELFVAMKKNKTFQ